jgi:TPR repeat protein
VVFQPGSQLTRIEDGAFSSCDLLLSIRLPSSLGVLGEASFSDCCLLSEVLFESGSRLSTPDGSSFGQFKWGKCLENGRGIGNDAREAVNYDKLSADQGNSSGQCGYGFCFRIGRGIAENETEGVEYFNLAADQGHWAGQLRIAFLSLRT